jgi:hypothetical protein
MGVGYRVSEGDDMKEPIRTISISVIRANNAAVWFHRGESVTAYFSITPSSLRRCQRAQLKLMEVTT